MVPEVAEVGGAVAPKPPRQRERAEAAKDHPAKRIDRYVTTKQPLLPSSRMARSTEKNLANGRLS